jgi:hypothetical protein
MKGMKGLVLATAAAALLASGFVATATTKDSAEVKCMGVNKCKGTGKCKSANNDCNSKNKCKGQGWVMEKSAESCTKAKGTVMHEEAKS